MSNKMNNKGFSLIELLAIVVILGIISVIGISATSMLSNKAKKNEMDAHKNVVTMSAQSYLQKNKNLVPKVVGESKNIQISELRESNYLTEDIKNSKGESCMENSYVRVYKLSKTEYTYVTYLYCGNEEVPETESVPSPKIDAKFTDSSGEVNNNKLKNVSDAYLYIEINSATSSEIEEYKNQNTHIQIDGYSFKIFTVKNGIRQESYNSGSLSAGREEKILINKKLKDYIDVTTITEVSVEVTAINTLGGITTINTTVSEGNTQVESVQYNDTVKPECVLPDNPYVENDWVNKQTYNLTKDARKLTVGCNDGTGSGCIRNYFTKSWPNDEDQYGAEYVYIQVKDNAGNVSENNEACRFRVNVDIQTPQVNITAYSGKSSTSNLSQTLANKIQGVSILSKSVTANDVFTNANITADDYKNLVSNSTDVKWLNNENYPNGIIYKIELKDNIRLDRWTWETNEGYINSTKDSKYLTVKSTNPEASSGDIDQDTAHGMTILHGSTFDTVYVRFYTEGMRYGVFTVYDKAGNKVQVTISANLDRTPPPVPNDLIAYLYDKPRTEGKYVSKTAYTFSTWTNKYVRVQTAAGQNRDDLTNGVTLSGFWTFYYDARNNGGTRVGSGDYSTNALGIGGYDFVGSAAQVDGKNKIRFMGCDKAGNCSDWGTYREEWIDISIPVCTVTKSITSGAESSYGWLGVGETARVTATCTDPTPTQASGCTVSSFHHDYNYEINTSTAGANGNNNAGSFSDAAGNSINCVADKRIQIDYHKPTCTVTGGSGSWTNNSRTVTGTCNDTGGSGCVGNISHTYNYDINTSSGGAAGNNNGSSIRDKADNVTACAANQTVKVDRTKPTISYSPSAGVYNIDHPGKLRVSATCSDNLSGLTSRYEVTYTVELMSPHSGYNIGKCCEDKAGNVYCGTNGLYSAKTYGRHPDCGVEQYYSCRTAGCGVESYNSCRTSACGVASYKSCKSSSCGTAVDYYICRGWASGAILYTCNPKCGICPSGYWEAHYGYKTCRSSSCGVESYNSCRTSACGVESYKYCENSACGIKRYRECWHYGLDQDIASH